ncbi:FAD-dependent oxidoreductase [Devosia sp.]|uniref:FAD-dependent oxidoreductase n=1 Tax=Devosia sp. TaxID=1871048 RepID=UPI001B2CC453|nr:FAD-dependent oxidoreductase [Devosia sp.]MBO9589047.1 NAD(P)/FAD-dependent oxidoreductase [Devosia sp.]
MSTSPDLCIIGAGTLGVDLALYARRLGASVVLADRDRPEPGDAVQQALRMASLVQSAKRAQDMRRAPELGVGASEFKLSAKQVAERANRLVENRIRATSPEVLTAQGVTVMRGAVSFVDGRSVLVGDITIKPGKVIIAIGGVPAVPDIPGLGDIDAFTVDSILENQRKLTHLVIVGSDAAAVEQAQLQRRLGAAVTLVPHGPLLSDFDPEAVSLLLSTFAEEGISVRTGAQVVAINRRSQGIGVEIEAEGGVRETLDASHVLVSAGRKVDLDELDIAKARLRPGTNASRTIRPAGTAAGHEEWNVARAHGRAVVDALLGRRRGNGQFLVPRLVETEPAIAQIGPLAPRAEKARTGDTILRENMAENDRAAAMGSERGLVKLALDGRGQIQRASLVDPFAAELAGTLALAMNRKVGLADLADLALPRPSLFEIFSRLGENYLAAQNVSTKGQGGRALRRWLRL